MTEPTPVLSILDELRTVEVGDKKVVLRFDNTGDHVDRVVHMGAQHPADLKRRRAVATHRRAANIKQPPEPRGPRAGFSAC